MTKSPPTSGSTLHDTPFSTGKGDCRPISSTRAAVTAPQMKVGSPSGLSSADAVTSTAPTATMPIAVSLPPRPSVGCGTLAAMVCAFNARCCVSRSTR